VQTVDPNFLTYTPFPEAHPETTPLAVGGRSGGRGGGGVGDHVEKKERVSRTAFSLSSFLLAVLETGWFILTLSDDTPSRTVPGGV